MPQIPKPMTTTERRELKSIIKNDFVLLGKEIDNRRTTIEDDAEAEVRKQFDAKIKRAKVAQEKLRVEADKFIEKVKGIEAGFIAEGLVPTNDYGSRMQAIKVTLATEWRPAGLSDAIRKARADVMRAAREAKLSLDRREHEFQKKLSLTAIETTEANDFLASLPAANEVLALDLAKSAASTAVLEAEVKIPDEGYDA